MAKRMSADEYLHKALVSAELVEFQRSVLDATKEQAFVVGIGRRWVLFEMLDSSLRLDGYQAVRRVDIVRVRRDPRSFHRRALAVSGQHRHVPVGIDLRDIRSLLRSASKHYRIVAIHTEYTNPRVCYVGCARPGKKRLHLDEISTNAKWIAKPEHYQYWSISRIDFDGQYERALLAVVDSETKPKKSDKK